MTTSTKFGPDAGVVIAHHQLDEARSLVKRADAASSDQDERREVSELDALKRWVEHILRLADIRAGQDPPVVDEARLYATTDATVWAEEFAKVRPDVDFMLMVGWFANAIETARRIATYDEKRHALTRLIVAADQMRDNWAESDEAVKAQLWRDLHEASERCAELHDVYPL